MFYCDMKRRNWQKKNPSEPSTEDHLRLAFANPALPSLDLHGMRRDDVRREINDLVDNNPGGVVRIIYGHGTGALAEEVLRCLRILLQNPSPNIIDFIEHPSGGSCIVNIR